MGDEIPDDLSAYEFAVPLRRGKKRVATLFFNAVTGHVYAKLFPEAFRMDRRRDGLGRSVEAIDDFIIRVGKRAEYTLGVTLNEFKSQDAEKRKAFELAEKERIAGAKPDDQRSYADGYRPPRKGRRPARPVITPKAQANAPGRITERLEPLAEGVRESAAEEDSGDSRFAIFEGTY